MQIKKVETYWHMYDAFLPEDLLVLLNKARQKYSLNKKDLFVAISQQPVEPISWYKKPKLKVCYTLYIYIEFTGQYKIIDLPINTKEAIICYLHGMLFNTFTRIQTYE